MFLSITEQKKNNKDRNVLAHPKIKTGGKDQYFLSMIYI